MKLVELKRAARLLPDSALSAGRWRADEPDVHLEGRDDDGRLLASCSAWWRRTPRHDGRRTAFVGHLSVSDHETGKEFLERVCDYLRGRACTEAIAPIDGSTWKSYRYPVGGSEAASFFMEPPADAVGLHAIERAGFAELARYVSTISGDLVWNDPKLERLHRRAVRRGYRIRSIDAGRLDVELSLIHDLAEESFRDNFLYTPITKTRFLEMYGASKDVLVEDLVLMLEHEGKLAGFVFAVPDLNQAKRGAAVDTVIIKTLAVSSAKRGLGLGDLLAYRLYRNARRLGFKRAIHALMLESNRSARIHDSAARVLRNYALFSRIL